MVDQTVRFEMDRLLSYDEESLLEELRRVALLQPDGPVTRAAFDAEARVHSTTLLRRFGGWQQALQRAGLSDRYGGKRISSKMRDQRARAASAADMVEELQRVAKIVGRSSITRADLLQHGNLIGERAIINRFGSWKAALESAGLKLSVHGRRWSDDDYFENLLEVWTHHAHAPTYAQMNQPPSRITNGAYAARFGTWGKAKLAFVDRVNDDLDLVQQEKPAARVPLPVPQRARQEDQRHIPIGLRYQVLRRDRFRCLTCGRSPSSDLHCVLHVDHTVPFSRGGKTTLENLRSLCAECNVGKGSKDH